MTYLNNTCEWSYKSSHCKLENFNFFFFNYNCYNGGSHVGLWPKSQAGLAYILGMLKLIYVYEIVRNPIVPNLQSLKH